MKGLEEEDWSKEGDWLERKGVAHHRQREGLRLSEGKNAWNWGYCGSELRHAELLSMQKSDIT